MIDAERRRALLAAKLRALTSGRGDAIESGIAARLDGTHLFVLLDDQPTRSLGRVLALATQRGCDVVTVIVDDAADAAMLRRRADGFAAPEIRIAVVEGTSTRVVTLAASLPTSLPVLDVPAELIEFIQQGGAEPVVEFGMLVGSIDGLEVCRVVQTDEPGLDGWRIEVGLGDHDREAFGMLHGPRPSLESFRHVVAGIAPHRQAGAPTHALNRIAPGPAMRAALLKNPGSVGLESLAPADLTVRRSAREQTTAVAKGHDADGTVWVFTSSGIDLELAPEIADRVPLGDRAIVVLAARDHHDVTRRLLAGLRVPVSVVTQ
jgi:hypothetical protein